MWTDRFQVEIIANSDQFSEIFFAFLGRWTIGT